MRTDDSTAEYRLGWCVKTKWSSLLKNHLHTNGLGTPHSAQGWKNMKDREADMEPNIVNTCKLKKAPRVTQITKVRREQRWGRARLPLTCSLLPQCPCRCDWHLTLRAGLGWGAQHHGWHRKVWKKQCWGSAILTLAWLWWHRCPWSTGGSLTTFMALWT